MNATLWWVGVRQCHDYRPVVLPPELAQLTAREIEVLTLVAQGLSNGDRGPRWS
jgi:ATP/maltotriose-dependent transcriptional regulator MalT